MRLKAILAMTALLAGCVTPDATAPSEFVLASGTLENLDYQPVDIPDDILGHGWITARLHVSQVHSGNVESDTLTVRYFAHTYQQLDEPGAYRLQRRNDGSHIWCMPEGMTGVHCSPANDRAQ